MLLNALSSALSGKRRAKPGSDAIALYLDLMKRCLTNSIYDDDLDLQTASTVLDPASGKYVPVEAAAANPDRKYHGEMFARRKTYDIHGSGGGRVGRTRGIPLSSKAALRRPAKN